MGKEKLNSYQRLKLMLKELQHDYDVLKKMKEIYQEAIEDIADPSLTVFAVAKAKEAMKKVQRLEDEEGAHDL